MYYKTRRRTCTREVELLWTHHH